MVWMVDLVPDDATAVQQAAALLVQGFREQAPDAWPDLASALEEVRESFGADRLSRVAVDERGGVDVVHLRHCVTTESGLSTAGSGEKAPVPRHGGLR